MSIKAELTPSHLLPPESERTASLEKAASAPAQSPSDTRKKRMEERRYPFRFSWTSSKGRLWEGEFTSEIPDQYQEGRIGAYMAQLASFAPFESLSPEVAGRLKIVATLTVCLLREGRPKWAEDIGMILDGALLQQLYAEVLEHQATFRG